MGTAAAAASIPRSARAFSAFPGPSGPRAAAMRPPRSPPRVAAASAARIAKIAEGLAAQEKLAKDYAKQRPAKPLNKGLLQYIKKSAWEK